MDILNQFTLANSGETKSPKSGVNLETIEANMGSDQISILLQSLKVVRMDVDLVVTDT